MSVYTHINETKNHNTMKNQFKIECSGITPDGVYGVVAVGVKGYFFWKGETWQRKNKQCRIPYPLSLEILFPLLTKQGGGFLKFQIWLGARLIYSECCQAWGWWNKKQWRQDRLPGWWTPGGVRVSKRAKKRAQKQQSYLESQIVTNLVTVHDFPQKRS